MKAGIRNINLTQHELRTLKMCASFWETEGLRLLMSKLWLDCRTKKSFHKICENLARDTVNYS